MAEMSEKNVSIFENVEWILNTDSAVLFSMQIAS